MLNDIAVEDRSRFHNVQKMVAAYETGQVTKDVTLCQWLFPCQKVVEEETQSRVKCSATSEYCPGYSIGCALCGMLAPDVCGSVCPFAGLYCGKCLIKGNIYVTMETTKRDKLDSSEISLIPL